MAEGDGMNAKIDEILEKIRCAQATESYHFASTLNSVVDDLYNAMLDSGSSYEELSKATGHTVRWLKRFFAGNDNVRLRDIVKVAHALNVRINISFTAFR